MVDTEKVQIAMKNKEVGIAWALGKQCEWPTVYYNPCPHITVQIQQTQHGQTSSLTSFVQSFTLWMSATLLFS